MAVIHALASKGTAEKPFFRMKASDPLDCYKRDPGNIMCFVSGESQQGITNA